MHNEKEERVLEALIGLMETPEEKAQVRDLYEADPEALKEKVRQVANELLGERTTPDPLAPTEGASLVWFYGTGDVQQELVAEIDRIFVHRSRIAVTFHSEDRDDPYTGGFTLEEQDGSWSGAGTTIYGSQREDVTIVSAHRQPNGSIVGDWREGGYLWRFELFTGADAE